MAQGVLRQAAVGAPTAVPALAALVHDEALGHLRALLAIDTTNPPGNEILAARYLESVLAREGLAGEIHEPLPGRASLVSRQRAAPGNAGEGGALLLTSHTDVVAAEASRWTHPPFSGAVADGCVWGRGAVDMKSMTVYGLMAFLLAKREGWPISRDLILAAVADEEAGGEWGMGWLVNNRPEAVRAEFALNEVGGFTLHLFGKRVYPVQVAEKGLCWFRLVAEGEPGHGSLPRPDSAVARLAAAVDRLARRPFPMRVTPPAARFIRGLARAAGPLRGLFLRALLVPGLSGPARRLVPRARARHFQALLSDTANPTCLAAGTKENVVPSRAVAVVDGRFLPGQTVEGFLEEVRRRVGPGFSIETISAHAPTETSPDTPLFELLRETLEKADPGATVVPNLLVGYTDAAALSRIGVRTYGFTPMRLPPEIEFSALFHGHDERIPLDAFRWGLECFVDAVKRFLTEPRFR
ncbi:MAG: M20/M25/M40 family metallo-hydrolase [Planctomycetes bacterium]|nr:M20/M25/M40 family metallo-hydrolase [Planctomycetota bacterium]